MIAAMRSVNSSNGFDSGRCFIDQLRALKMPNHFAAAFSGVCAGSEIASPRIIEIGLVLVRLDDIAGLIVNADHSVTWAAENLANIAPKR